LDERGKLIGQQFYKDSICNILTMFGTGPVLMLPILQDLATMRKRGLIIDDLGIFLRILGCSRALARGSKIKESGMSIALT
jgi:hypothetical protein